MSETTRQTLGVSVFVKRSDKILIGRRGPACKRGAGCFALPGGVLQHPESFLDCVRREVREETGLGSIMPMWGISDVPFSIPGLLSVTDHFDIAQILSGKLGDHMTFWILVISFGNEAPRVTEPDKCLGWEWIRPDALAKKLGDAANNPTSEQYQWTPMPLWRHILHPYFGDF